MPICKKWFQTKELQAEDFKSDAILDKSTPRKKLFVNAENIYRAFRQGSYLKAYTNDVNCMGTEAKVEGTKSDSGPITVNNIVTHYEYKIIVAEVKLTVDTKTSSVVNNSNDIKLNCKVETQQCSMNLNQYVWTEPTSNCNLYHIKFVTGYELQTNEEKYFVANQSMIYLKMVDNEIKCNKRVIRTDLKDIYLLEQLIHFNPKQSYIEQELETKDLKINLDVISRDMYLYNRLLDNLENQNRQIMMQHCLDDKIMKARLFSTLNKIQNTETFHPLRLDNEGIFVLPVGEILTKFRCKKNKFFPIKLAGESCYKNLPVVQIDEKTHL